MKLYYTVSSAVEAVQTKPQLSLGCFKSQTQLANSVFGNMFSEITPTTISNFNQNQYIALVLKNTTGVKALDVNLYFTFPVGCFSIFRIAVIDMTLDSNGILQMEHIDNQFSKPLNATFHEASTVANKVSIGDLEIDEQVGVWVERELLLDVIKASQDNVYIPDPALEGRFIPVVPSKFDDIGLTIAYS